MTELQHYSGRKVLITGNTGFKGAWLTTMLLRLGAQVIGVASFSGREYPSFKALEIEKEIQQYKFDISDSEALEKLIEREKPEFIFHLASQPITLMGMEKPLYTIQTNVLGTANLLEAVRRTSNQCNLIIVTSDKCYQNKEWHWSYRENDRLFGADPYGASKSMVENVAHAYYSSYFKSGEQVRICTVRAGNVFGGGDWSENRLVPDCIRAWTINDEIEIRSPQATRPWTYVLDVLYGYLTAGINLDQRDTLNGESYNFGPTALESVSVDEFVHGLWGFFGPEGVRTPLKVLSSSSMSNENELLQLSSEKAISVLGWKPKYDMEGAMNQTIKWYKQYLHEPEGIKQLTDLQLSEYLTIQAGGIG
jgi:CDP-glucose 4,6-dehydratase